MDTTTPGFARGRKLDKLRARRTGPRRAVLHRPAGPGQRAPRDGERGFRYLTSNLAHERLSIAVNSQAAAVAALDWTVADVAGTGAGQDTRFVLAACATEVAAGQALVDQAISEHLGERLGVGDAALVKLFATELQGRVVERAVFRWPTRRRRTRPARRSATPTSTAGSAGSTPARDHEVIVAQQLGL